MHPVDSFGRKISYLRLSVTDRCNLRCCYCMPPQGVPDITHLGVLRYEELLAVARAAVSLGIGKIRVTGGEPLVRKGIVPFLARLAAIPGLAELALTTNGTLLPEMAAELRTAGVQRLNISIDSLRPGVFARITRCGDLTQLLRGIDAALEAGFPVKLNMVVMRGINDGELEEMAAFTRRPGISVRFIEYMPVIREENWQELVVPGDEIIARLGARYHLAAVAREATAGPAREFALAGAPGTVGVITPLTGHFCGSCNRIRVTAAGIARSCLFSDNGIDLRPALAQGEPEALQQALLAAVRVKPRQHRLTPEECDHQPFAMSGVGG